MWAPPLPTGKVFFILQGVPRQTLHAMPSVRTNILQDIYHILRGHVSRWMSMTDHLRTTKTPGGAQSEVPGVRRAVSGESEQARVQIKQDSFGMILTMRAMLFIIAKVLHRESCLHLCHGHHYCSYPVHNTGSSICITKSGRSASSRDDGGTTDARPNPKLVAQILGTGLEIRPSRANSGRNRSILVEPGQIFGRNLAGSGRSWAKFDYT